MEGKKYELHLRIVKEDGKKMWKNNVMLMCVMSNKGWLGPSPTQSQAGIVCQNTKNPNQYKTTNENRLMDKCRCLMLYFYL